MNAVPRKKKVGSDTLGGPSIMAQQHTYKVQYPSLAAMQQISSKDVAQDVDVTKGVLLAEAFL